MFLIQLFSMLGRAFEFLHLLMWVALVVLPLWLIEKAILAAAMVVARTDPNFVDVEGDDRGSRD